MHSLTVHAFKTYILIAVFLLNRSSTIDTTSDTQYQHLIFSNAFNYASNQHSKANIAHMYVNLTVIDSTISMVDYLYDIYVYLKCTHKCIHNIK